jgi:hypothetical protein
VQGTVFLGFVIGSEGRQLFVQILSSRPRVNQPSGVCVQYRADHGPAPGAERGSFELPSSIQKIFSASLAKLQVEFSLPVYLQRAWLAQKSLFAFGGAISIILGLRVINQSCYS